MKMFFFSFLVVFSLILGALSIEGNLPGAFNRELYNVPQVWMTANYPASIFGRVALQGDGAIKTDRTAV